MFSCCCVGNLPPLLKVNGSARGVDECRLRVEAYQLT